MAFWFTEVKYLVNSSISKNHHILFSNIAEVYVAVSCCSHGNLEEMSKWEVNLYNLQLPYMSLSNGWGETDEEFPIFILR